MPLGVYLKLKNGGNMPKKEVTMTLFPKILAGNSRQLIAAAEEARRTHYFKSPSSGTFSPVLDLIELVMRNYYKVTAPTPKLEKNGNPKG